MNNSVNSLTQGEISVGDRIVVSLQGSRTYALATGKSEVHAKSICPEFEELLNVRSISTTQNVLEELTVV